MRVINGILNNRSKTITFAAFILGGAALISRFLGLLRDRILAGEFGVGDDLDKYYVAFRLPDLVYNIVIMGAISSVFIPVFFEYWTINKKEAWRLVNNFLNITLFGLIFLCFILIILTPWFVPLIAPGFWGEKLKLTIWLTRIMFLSPIIFGIGGIFGGVLQSFRKFFIYSLAPILYNVGIIFGALYLTDLAQSFGWDRVMGLVWGVILGALLHLIIQIPGCILSGFRYQWVFNIFDKGFRKIINLMLPRTIGLAAYQVNLIVITAIASTLAAGSVTVFNLANNLQYVPIGVIGISFATAVFPALSQEFAENQKLKFVANFSSTFRQILFFAFPISFLFILLRAQLVRVILGTGKFDWPATQLTAAALGLFGISIFAQSLIPLLSRAFYALHDTRTPVFISILSIILNIIGSFFFVYLLSFQNCFQVLLKNTLDLESYDYINVMGLPLAFSLAAIFNLTLLTIFLWGKIGNIDLPQITNSFSKIFFASVIMAVSVYKTLGIAAEFVDTHTGMGLLIQGVVAGLVGVIIYLVIVWFFRSSELFLIFHSFRRQFSQKIIPQQINDNLK